jgi:hypothetical protein
MKRLETSASIPYDRGSEAMVVAQEEFIPGRPVVIEASSPSRALRVMFEDDGDTGYFYGLDFGQKENPIVDALHIYDVANVVDREQPSTAEILWSADGLKACLLINGYAHAVFDFESKRGYCRTGFPPPDTKWTSSSHDWEDAALEHFE